ncbi:MAG TPA: hypothetical protein VJ853_03820 [Thermoanaerobaculia bacterium]|nr:hypothetical protein [Thermoanaerobaculia bacterium]
MSIIDWSDPEEMLGLLGEYIRDELQQERDRERVTFLRRLSSAVGRLEPAAAETLERLRRIYDSQPEEFAADSVLIHVRDCLKELARIVAQS